MAKKKVKDQSEEEMQAGAPDELAGDADAQGAAAEILEEAVGPDGGAARPEEDVVALKEQIESCQDKLLRMAAEQDNFKKRMIRERETALKYAEEGILRDLLPTIDNLERALGQEQKNKDVQTLFEGVELTLKGLLGTLSKFGLIPIESVGQPFDPNFHEALVMEASASVPAQCIIKEFEKGYQYKDRLLRAAKVVVSKGEEG